MALDDMQGAGQADTSARDLADHVAAALKALEDLLEVFGWNAHPMVLDCQEGPTGTNLLASKLDGSWTVVWAVFDSVVKNVRQRAHERPTTPPANQTRH